MLLMYAQVCCIYGYYFIAAIREVGIELMNNEFSEASRVELCALLEFTYGVCSDDMNFTVDLLVVQNIGLKCTVLQTNCDV